MKQRAYDSKDGKVGADGDLSIGGVCLVCHKALTESLLLHRQIVSEKPSIFGADLPRPPIIQRAGECIHPGSPQR
jgi:hypothetical protein